MTVVRKLYRSRGDKVWLGLIGGLAEYFEADSTLLRLIFLGVVVFTGFVPGLVFYLIGSVIVPVKLR